MSSKVEVEYCGSCGHLRQFEELSSKLKEKIPSATVTGVEGRRGSFEVKINDSLVYSKLQTMAFPDYAEVVDAVMDAEQGHAPRQVTKQQPINCCVS